MTDNRQNKGFGLAGDPPARPSFAERMGFAGTETVAETVATRPADEQAVGSETYKAYGYVPAASVQESCDAQWWAEGLPHQMAVARGTEFQYRFLIRIAYAGEELLQLVFTDGTLVIEGRHLRDLRKKLSRRQVTFLQAFHAGVHGLAPNDGTPVITRMDFVTGNDWVVPADRRS